MTDDNADWDYKPDGQTKTEPPKLGNRGIRPVAKKTAGPQSIEWAASEYIEHSRGASWYLGLIVAAVVIAGVLYLLTKDYIASIIVVITAIVVAVFSLQKPREVTYSLSPEGLLIGEKLYSYGHFKSFSIVREGGLSSINLMPIKRFLPVISLYFEPTQEANIVQVLGQHLPYEQRQPDRVDRLSRRLKL